MPALHSRLPTDALADTLASETRLLVELRAIMRRQRAAVAEDDLQTVEDSVYATHRVLRTLSEARRRRDSLIRVLGYPSVGEIVRGEAPHLPAELRSQCGALQRMARALSGEVEASRRILRDALANSDECPLAQMVATEPIRFAPPA